MRTSGHTGSRTSYSYGTKIVYGFVHVPKTGGATIGLLPGCRGHYPVSEFQAHDHAHEFFTMVRDPYDVMCSAYYFVIRKDIDLTIGTSPFDIMNSELVKLPIEEFLAHTPANQLYSHYYDTLTPRDFTIVGHTVEYSRTRELFARMTKRSLPNATLNVNPDHKAGEAYDFAYSRKDFAKRFDNDYQLYYEGLDRFKRLCSDHGIIEA